MNNHPQFRLAGESDADALLEFMEAYYASDGHGFEREEARAALTALFAGCEPRAGLADSG
jgi:hypothetical protein